MDAVRAEDVRDLVRVGDDGGRAEREDEARELVHEELRGLQVHVRVDEPGDDVLAARVDDLAARVLAQASDVAVAMATSVSSHSRVKTEKTRPPWMTTSASSSPRAPLRAVARDRARGNRIAAQTTARARGELHLAHWPCHRIWPKPANHRRALAREARSFQG